MPEETVPQPAAPLTVHGHYEAAKAEAASKDAAAAAPAPVAGTPPDEPAPAGDRPQETATPEDHLLPAEEAAKLTGDARQQYDRMNKAFTQKTQALARERKRYEPWNNLISGLEADPDAAIAKFAADRGYTVAKKAQEAAAGPAATPVPDSANIETLVASKLPEELKFLTQPLASIVGELRKEMTDSFAARVKPIEETHRKFTEEQIEAATNAEVKAWGNGHKDWEKHEPAMLEMAKKLPPGPGMPISEYMDALLRLATFDITQAERTKEVVAQLTKSANGAEKPAPGVGEKTATHAMPAAGKRSIKDAFAAAKQGIVWEK